MGRVSAERRKKRPTQREVAELAGVSQAAVSQVLNGSQGGIRIPEVTRQRVLEVMREVGYVPNVAAQRLAGGQNRIMGVFTYEPVFPSSTRDFFSPFLEGIEEAAAELDYDLLLHTRPALTIGGVRPLYRNGTTRLRLADGTIMLGQLNDERRSDLTRLLSEGHPVVFIGRRDLAGQSLPYVTADYAAATAAAVQALYRHGHHQTVYVGADAVHESATDRETGYRRGLTGEPGAVLRVAEVTAELVRTTLQRGITGVLFENERLTVQWIRAADQLGARWPADYAFALLGDPIFQEKVPAGWAHFGIPRLEMGRQAVYLLQRALAGEQASVTSLPCHWVPGSSMGENHPG